MSNKKRIGVLTGGGDVPGLNPAIRGLTLRALQAGYEVIGFRRGWAGVVEVVPDPAADNSDCFIKLTEEMVSKAGRTGGTFLHTSRTNPTRVAGSAVPKHLQGKYSAEKNDLTADVIKNLEFLGLDFLVPIGGDDTLSYGVRLHKEGVKVVAIPKTMDNDVPGTDYCLGFSTCISRTIETVNRLRTVAGSHERILVMEVFGRYAGFTALLPVMAGAGDRCVIPEFEFNIDRLVELLVQDRNHNPSKYAIVLVSEGAKFAGSDMVFSSGAKDAFGHAKLGGIGDMISAQIKELSPKYNGGKSINVLNQKLGYVVRGGDPDAIDAIVPMVYGNLAFELIQQNISGRLVVLKDGQYGNVPLEEVTSRKKVVDVEQFYDTDQLRPKFTNFYQKPMLLMPSG